MKTIIRAAALAAFAVSLPSAATAGAIVAGFDGTTADPRDDNAFGPVGLSFDANFFGQTYSQLYVSNNGYFTFNSPQSNYTAEGLGTGYTGQPIIAAFYSDVDASRGGRIGYGTAQFEGREAFGATWTDVNYYNPSGTPKSNSFQLLIVDRNDTGAGNFDIVFNYDRIQWETGSAQSSGGVEGLGGISAAVGYNAGQPGNPAGTYYEMPGSRTPGSFLDGGTNSLSAGSNVGVAGRYLFNVRNGIVAPPPPAVPEPATWAMMIGGFGLVGGAMRRRRPAVTFA